MTNPTRRPLVALLVGFVSGVVVIGGAVLAMGAWLLVRGLPDDPMAVEAYRSPEPSRLEASDGRSVAEFPMVEAVEPLRADPTLLVEAYLALHDGAFYEARVDRSLPLLPVVSGALRGERLLASPLSRAVARSLAAGTKAGTLRDLRTDLLAARLDGDSELHRRTAAYLQTLPLCHGRRGVVEALRACLGVTDAAAIGPAEAALLAAAAAFELDLADDLEVLEARAAAVLDRLTLQRRLDAEEATSTLALAMDRARSRRTSDRALGEDPLVVSLTEETRRRFGMTLEPAPLVLRTTLRSEAQAGLLALSALRGGTWVVVDPRVGAATAMGGDLSAPIDLAPDSPLSIFVPGEDTPGDRPPTVSDLVGGLLGAVEALSGGPPGDAAPRRLEPVTSLRVGERTHDVSRDGPVVRAFDAAPEDAWLALDALPREGRLRVAREGRLLVFAHPRAIGVLRGPEAAAMEALRLPPSVLAAAPSEDEFGVPDGLWVATDGTVHRRGASAQ